MFFTYPIGATAENWIHESICSAIHTIFKCIDLQTPIPNWPDVLPASSRIALRRMEVLPRTLHTFSNEAQKLSKHHRDEFLCVMSKQNQITGLLDGTLPIPLIKDELAPLLIAAKAVFDTGFDLLTQVNVRKKHYKFIWDSLASKTCPFCGMEAFSSPNSHSEDEDHYLARSIYPLAAANFLNLVPMGSKCNKLYKGRVDLLRRHGVRRRVFNPYGQKYAEITLNKSVLYDANYHPVWSVDFIDENEETQTWDAVFCVRQRLKDDVLTPYYETWLDDLIIWFKILEIDQHIETERLSDQIDKIVTMTRKNSGTGLEFIKNKFFEMIAHRCRLGDLDVIASIRNALPAQIVIA